MPIPNSRSHPPDILAHEWGKGGGGGGGGRAPPPPPSPDPPPTLPRPSPDPLNTAQADTFLPDFVGLAWCCFGVFFVLFSTSIF